MTKEEILDIIEEEGVEFIRLQFTDVFGRLKNMSVTPGQMERVFRNRHSFEGRAIYGGRYECDEKLYLRPSLNSFTILPWRPQRGKVAAMTCDVCYEDGTPFEFSSRQILKNVLNKIENDGYSFIVDPQCEFFLFHTDDNGMPTTNCYESAGYLDVAPSDFGETARHDIVLMLEEMGFIIESSHHEGSPAQHEIDFEEADALTTADAIQKFRFAVRSIAKGFGLHATFMAKPRNDMDGSSMHVNFTMLKDGRNIFRNADGSASDAVYYFIGGILKHGAALTAIGNPTVNSYKHLLTGSQAPKRLVWSSKGQHAFVKLKEYANDVKIELRFPDGTANPYLLIAACIEAGMDGIKNRIEPGDNLTLNSDIMQTSPLLPGSLKEALDALDADEVVQNAIGLDFADIYKEIKYNEWQDYMNEVSAWEINRYLNKV